MQRNVFEIVNGKLAFTGEGTAYESAGYLYFVKTPENKTKVVLFEGVNDKDKTKFELEYASIGKNDYDMLPKKASDLTPEVLAKFIAHCNANGIESPEATAAREGFEETDGVISTPPKNKMVNSLKCSPHACWIDQTTTRVTVKDKETGLDKEVDKRKDIATQIDIFPYEVTQEQFNALINKKYSKFTRAVAADLDVVDGKPRMMLEGVDLLDAANKARLRGFNATMLKFYAEPMTKMFTDVATVASVHNSNVKGFAGAGLGQFAAVKPEAQEAPQKRNSFGK